MNKKQVLGMIIFACMLVSATGIYAMERSDTENRTTKEKRDAKRVIDLQVLVSAINLAQQKDPSIQLGDPNVVYTSLLASNSDCADLTLPTLPQGKSYRCITDRKNLQNTDGTGWLPIQFTKDSIRLLPIDPLNTASTYNYYAYTTNGTIYKLWALVESQKFISTANGDGGIAPIAIEKGSDVTLSTGTFPDGWVRVPGNSTFGTSDFYVMQYEAKCLFNGVPQKSPNSGWNTYWNIITPCTAQNSRTVASHALGYPIGYVSQTDAALYCQNTGARLVTNNEWQTIAWNIQNKASNWSNGLVGSGFIPLGNTWSAAEEATDPGQGQYRRTNLLSNNLEIWDLSGNVYEWTNNTILGTNKPLGIAGSAVEWPTVSNFGSLTRNEIKPVSDTYSYISPSVNYIGLYYQGSQDGTTYGFVRGGRWPFGQGIEDLDLGNPPETTRSKTGFRCAKALQYKYGIEETKNAL